MSLCISDNVALSDAAFAVYKILLEIIAKTWGNSTALPSSAGASDTAPLPLNGEDSDL
jgi:LysR family transcriptional regulator, nitrogen assimilation regulatory protein